MLRDYRPGAPLRDCESTIPAGSAPSPSRGWRLGMPSYQKHPDAAAGARGSRQKRPSDAAQGVVAAHREQNRRQEIGKLERKPDGRETLHEAHRGTRRSSLGAVFSVSIPAHSVGLATLKLPRSSRNGGPPTGTCERRRALE
jgi:hypothetical protein